MSQQLTRRRVLAGGATAAAASLAGCAGSTPFVGQRRERFETIQLEDATTLSISGDVGDVSVTGADREDLSVDIVEQSSSLRGDLDDLELQTRRDGDDLTLDVVYEGSVGWFARRPEMNLDVTVPRSVTLDAIETDTGRVSATDVQGPFTAEASTGEVHLRDVEGDVEASTSTGRVDAQGVRGRVTASTSTGEIRVRDVDEIGDLDASTGEIDADVPAIDGDTSITASTGELTVRIAPDLDAELRASTSTGDIDVDGLDLDESVEDDDTLVGTLGDGGPTLRLETSTGEISIDALE